MTNYAQNQKELEALKAQKMGTFYGVKSGFGNTTKDVDMTKRTVKSIPNTYLFFDYDQDVLVPGCAVKTLQERGPNSNAAAKIKNVKDHNITQRIGKPELIDERKVDGMDVMYAESKMLTTTLGNDILIEYQEGVIDNHSIGFRYIDLEFITNESEEWKKWVDQLINPKEAEAAGYMFLVKEIAMMEWSPVSFGANKLTPYMGVKSGNKDGYIMKLHDRLDLLEKQLRSGTQSDLAMYDYSLEVLQLKQIISELFNQEPSMKDTLILQQRRFSEDTNGKNTGLTACLGCGKSFNYTDEPEAGTGYVKCPGCGQFCTQSGISPVTFDIDKAIKETKFFNHQPTTGTFFGK